MREKGSKVLRRMLREKELIVAPGVYDVMTARLAEAAGFRCLYMTGSGTSEFTLGLPDIGLITMNEMVENAARIAAQVEVPLISDADTGFGNALGVRRTVAEFIQRGVAGIHIEDQVSPKRCGHTAGKICMSAEENMGKIRAVADVRDEMDPDFVLIARCDFRGATGGSLDGAIERANLYVDAGADVSFVEALLSVDELKRVIREVRSPIFYNMTGLSPLLTEQELRDLGVAIVIMPGASSAAAFVAVRDYMRALKEDLRYQREFSQVHGLAYTDIPSFVGLARSQELEEKYLPREMLEARYARPSIGTFAKRAGG